LSKIEAIHAILEKLEDLLRLGRDLHLVLSFRLRLEETEGIADLIILSTDERIFTKLTAEDINAIDAKITEMIEALKEKALKLK